MAAAAPDPNTMRILLDGGADPTLASKTNVTPLLAAAGVGRAEDFTEAEQLEALEAVKLMVELGGDVNAANDTGLTALHGSSNLGANLIIQYLIDKGAKLDVRDKHQQTPLSIASGIHLPWTPKGQELGEVIRPATADIFLKAGATPVNTPGYFTPPTEDSDAYRLNPRRETPGLN
jgi:ankyrin repeat protein